MIMNFKNIIKDYMKDEYARQIINWKYEDEYAVYNLPSFEECIDKNYRIVRETEKKNYIVYVLDSEVIFFSSVRLKDNKIYLGVGLKPDYCGKGYSTYFLEDIIKSIKKKYPNTIINLDVRTWNKRAIKSYEKVGFKIVDTFTINDSLNNIIEYYKMELK